MEDPLTSLAGVNLAKVKKIAVGLGDRADRAGGAGRIFVDDIYVRKSTPHSACEWNGGHAMRTRLVLALWLGLLGAPG